MTPVKPTPVKSPDPITATCVPTIIRRPRFFRLVQVTLCILLDITLFFTISSIVYFFQTITQIAEFDDVSYWNFIIPFAIVVCYQIIALIGVMRASYWMVLALATVETIALIKDFWKHDYLMAGVTAPIAILSVVFFALIRKSNNINEKRYIPSIVLTHANNIVYV